MAREPRGRPWDDRAAAPRRAGPGSAERGPPVGEKKLPAIAGTLGGGQLRSGLGEGGYTLLPQFLALRREEKSRRVER